jgi:hypothetical protein
MGTTKQRDEYACPSWSEWETPTVALDPLTTGTEVTDKEEIDMGSVAGGANTDAKALTVEFEDDFDDTVNEVRLWLLNNPQHTGHTWRADMDSGLLMPAVSLDATLPVTGTDADLRGSPFESNHEQLAAAVYDSTNKRIATILIQLVAAASPKVWDQDATPYAAPALVANIYRRAKTLDGAVASLDLELGELFTFSSTDLYLVETDSSGNEYWQLVAEIKDDSISIGITEEHVQWQKYKPTTTIHQARASITDSISFQIDQCNPKLMALGLQTVVSENTAHRTLDVSHDAKVSAVKRRKWVVGWNNVGAHRVYAEVKSGVLKPAGEMVPGGGDFSGMAMTLDALTTSPTSARKVIQFKISDAPVEQAIIPLNYNVTA